MEIAITGRHTQITDALKTYVTSRLEKLQTHFDNIIDAHVVLSVEKYRQCAEVSLHTNGLRIHGKEITPDMYASVDLVLDKLEKQIKKYKARIIRHQPRHQREARSVQMTTLSMPEAEDEAEESLEPSLKIIKQEKVAAKPMSTEEAVMQLELIDEPFLIFANSATNQVNVIYRMNDGNYGLIQPES